MFIRAAYLVLAFAFFVAGVMVAVNEQTLVSQLAGQINPVQLTRPTAWLAGLFWVLLAVHCAVRVLLPAAESGPRFWLPFGLLILAGLSFIGAHLLQFYFNQIT